MKFFFFLTLLSLQLAAASYSQNARFNFTFSDVSLREVFQAIRQQSDFTFVYNVDDIRHIRVNSLEMQNALLEDVLRECFKDTRLSYVIEDNVIIVTPQVSRSYKLSGVVRDHRGMPLPGVTVVIKGT